MTGEAMRNLINSEVKKLTPDIDKFIADMTAIVVYNVINKSNEEARIERKGHFILRSARHHHQIFSTPSQLIDHWVSRAAFYFDVPVSRINRISKRSSGIVTVIRGFVYAILRHSLTTREFGEYWGIGRENTSNYLNKFKDNYHTYSSTKKIVDKAILEEGLIISL